VSASTVFDAIAPSLASDPNKALFIILAADRVSSCRFAGTKHDLAVALRAAHDLTLANQTGVGGIRSHGESGSITAKREADLSISFSGGYSSDSSADLDLTVYGKRLKGLMRGTVPAVGVTGGYLRNVCN
jgi:hypothetical protein